MENLVSPENLVFNILKTDAPDLNYYTSMNRLYLLLDINNRCNRGQDYSSITVVVTTYAEDQQGNLDPTDVIDSWSRTYQRFQFNHREEPDNLPPYNIFVDLNNHWYEIQLTFNFPGANSNESRTSTFRFDNRITTLYRQEVSGFFLGLLKDNLKKVPEFTVWFKDFAILNLDTIEYDLVSNNTGTLIKQVRVDQADIRVLATDKNYMNITKYILNHSRLSDILNIYYDGIIPTDTTFTFKIQVNNIDYFIHFKGNLKFIR